MRCVRSTALLALLTVSVSCGGRGYLSLVSVGPTVEREVHVPGGTVRAKIGTRGQPVRVEAFEAWIARAAHMVADYCGGFPVETLDVTVITGAPGGVAFGEHWGGRSIRVIAGQDTDRAELERDWVMVHEMLHAAFPRVARRHRWMQEGLSTYLETVLRGRHGVFTAEEVWARWVRHMPRGLPRRGERGLDHTRTWAATYWGGALFWMMVDVELRARTDDRRSLQDVLRGILARGGNARVFWTPRRIVRVADEATGTRVVSERYDAMARRPSDVDLDALFSRLGVRVDDDGAVALVDDAPLAFVRRSITAPGPTPLPPLPR